MHTGSEQNDVVEFYVIGPDGIRVLEVVLIERGLWSDFFFGKLLGIGPLAVIKVDSDQLSVDVKLE